GGDGRSRALRRHPVPARRRDAAPDGMDEPDVGGVPRGRSGGRDRAHHARLRQEEDERGIPRARSHDGLAQERRRSGEEESAMNRATDPYEAREPGALERDIDRTRSSLGRTIDELENRLS